jgi:two-component system nitrogen regulation response regulator NtrX
MKTILLIEDNTECPGLEDVLKKFGHKVVAVEDGASALSIIRAGVVVDLVITDCWITALNGLELLASLRRLAPAVPSIMLTAHGSVETYLKACSLGVFEYVNKPVTAQELGRIVRAALERAQTVERYEREQVAAREG